MRREIESAGMAVAMVTTYSDFTNPCAEIRAREARRCERHIASAAVLGAEMVRVTAGQAHPEVDQQTGLAWAIKGLTGMLPCAEKHGIQLVFENHSKPGVWEHADFAHPTDRFLSIVDATAGTRLGINFDTANPLVAGDHPLPILRAVMNRLVSVHAADTRSLGALEPAVIGTGLVPFTQIFGALKSAGFDGWICIEEASGTGRAGVAQAVSFVRQTWSNA
jgi:sugar phosphate isomerase/epimerase